MPKSASDKNKDQKQKKHRTPSGLRDQTSRSSEQPESSSRHSRNPSKVSLSSFNSYSNLPTGRAVSQKKAGVPKQLASSALQGGVPEATTSGLSEKRDLPSPDDPITPNAAKKSSRVEERMADPSKAVFCGENLAVPARGYYLPADTTADGKDLGESISLQLNQFVKQAGYAKLSVASRLQARKLILACGKIECLATAEAIEAPDAVEAYLPKLSIYKDFEIGIAAFSATKKDVFDNEMSKLKLMGKTINRSWKNITLAYLWWTLSVADKDILIRFAEQRSQVKPDCMTMPTAKNYIGYIDFNEGTRWMINIRAARYSLTNLKLAAEADAAKKLKEAAEAEEAMKTD